MADSKHTITINTKAVPDTSTPTQIVAPSQITRPTFDQGERQSMVNKQAHSIRDEQATQGISIPWGDALRQASEEWKDNVEAANTLADTQHQSVITPVSQDTISEAIVAPEAPELLEGELDSVVGPEILENGLDFGPIDTNTVDVSAVEEALDGVFGNVNEVIKDYVPNLEPITLDVDAQRPKSNMDDRWWEAKMAPTSEESVSPPITADVISSSRVLAQEDASEESDDIASDTIEAATTEHIIVPSPRVLSQEDAREESDDVDSLFEEGMAVVSGDDPLELIVPASGTAPEDRELTAFEEPPEGPVMGVGEPPTGGNPLVDSIMEGMTPDYGRRGGNAATNLFSGVVPTGMGGSSDSAATAIQTTGTMVEEYMNVGRDALASQMEKSAMGAKVAVALATKGEIIPTSEGGEGGSGGGGDVVSAALSMAGGDGGDGGGGGGGGIDGLIGGAIDDIFGAPVKSVDMFIDAMAKGFDVISQWTSAIEESYNEIMGFSGAMVGARIETELGILQKKIERANNMGTEFAAFETERGDLLLAFEDLKTVLLKIFMPIAKVALRVITKILDLITWVLNILNEIKNMILNIAIEFVMLFAWIPWIGDHAAKAAKTLRDIRGNTDKPDPNANNDSLGGWLGWQSSHWSGQGGHPLEPLLP